MIPFSSEQGPPKGTFISPLHGRNMDGLNLKCMEERTSQTDKYLVSLPSKTLRQTG